jgi:hypothetical protein
MTKIDPNNSGWIDHKQGVAEIEALKPVLIYGGTPEIRESGRGKTRLLYSVYETFPVIHQGSAPSCVACATGGAFDCLRMNEIADGDRERFVNFAVEEFIYYVSRVIIGNNRLRGSGGSLVSWAVAGLDKIGAIVKGVYDGVDLTKYDPQRAVDWGDGRNVPSQLVNIAKGQKILDFVRIKSYEEARDAIYNKYPVIVGSRYGFSRNRDDEGFAVNNTTWAHAMWWGGVDDSGQRPGVCNINSWGRNYHRGPKRYNQPDSSFWIDAEIADRMCRNGDALGHL